MKSRLKFMFTDVSVREVFPDGTVGKNILEDVSVEGWNYGESLDLSIGGQGLAVISGIKTKEE